jgi:hypothetical protein
MSVDTSQRVAALYDRQRHDFHARMDRLMLIILLGQWVLALVLALTV